MKRTESDLLIIGAGLSGLVLAYYLKDSDKTVTVVEARARTGGRIFTSRSGDQHCEMGATWLGSQHTQLLQLLQTLSIHTYQQELGNQAFYEPMSSSPPQLVQLPPNSDPSFKIVNGTQEITDCLAQAVGQKNIQLNTPINTISEEGDHICAYSHDQVFKAKKIVSTLAPHLLFSTIEFNNSINKDVLAISKSTHTWMGDSIKICIQYKNAFWKGLNSSGTIFSNVGPIPELYDHSTENQTALVGFLHSAYYSDTKEQRLDRILTQLEKYYGAQVRDFQYYEEYIWRKDPFTFSDYATAVLPHQHNGHHIYRESYLNNKLWIAGSETAAQYPGYMEGAVRSAAFIYKKLKQDFL